MLDATPVVLKIFHSPSSAQQYLLSSYPLTLKLIYTSV